MHTPYEALKITWYPDGRGFQLHLPWLDMEIDIDDADKDWIVEASKNLHQKPELDSVQKFCDTLGDYPIAYRAPRSLEDFEAQSLQACPNTLSHLDFSSPDTFLRSLNIESGMALADSVSKTWSWDLEKILSKTNIPDTELFDPISVVTYLICYRLHWESETWSGKNGLGGSLEKLLQMNEDAFFKAIGWITRQSHYVTKQFHHAVLPALEHFPKAEKEIQHFIQDEVGHYKFMEQTLTDLGFQGAQDFSLGAGTKWLLDAFEAMGSLSPLAFSAMVNIFEAAYYEGQDPLSRVFKMSSRPQAAKGYDLHYKINKEHRHCDMPVIFSKRVAPQTKDHVELTVRLFEITLHFLDEMEQGIFVGMQDAS